MFFSACWNPEMRVCQSIIGGRLFFFAKRGGKITSWNINFLRRLARRHDSQFSISLR